MLKKILKRVLFGLSVIASALFGFVSGDKGHSDLSTNTVLGEPIFSVRTAHADGGSGDCCCGCACDVYPTGSSGVGIGFTTN